MGAALLLLVLVVLPGALFLLQCEGMRWFTGESPAPRALRATGRRLRRLGDRVRRRREPEPLPPVLLTLELRRLADDIRLVESGNQPHRAARLGAALAAYDRVLLELCLTADIEAPTSMTPLHHSVRLDLETELVASGMDW